ncbi:MAG: hypothetical protein EPO12_10625 [Aquabacterium sp.]|nr:MAG: hypothetical protein EPO12_10625 [Aquabacterium sp.]
MTASSSTASPGSSWPAEGRFEGRRAFQDHVRGMLGAVAAGGCPELVLCDPSFEDWPLGERGLMDTWTRWATTHSNGRCILIAASFEGFARQHPLWVAWRQAWSHRVQCLQPVDDLVGSLPSWFFVKGRFLLERVDPVGHRGLLTREASRLVLCQEGCDAITQRSLETFPATTLGL